MPDWLQDMLELTGERLVWKPEATEAFVVARTASKDRPEALQGFHAENLMFILEEASGIDDIVFEVAQGALSTPGAKVIMCGNPTRLDGYFYRAFHGLRDRWHTMHVSSEDVPRARGHIEDVAAAYGRDSNIYRVRVLGEFPTEDDDTVIPLSLLEAAQHRQVERTGTMHIWGVDVARFGDDRSALARRYGNTMTHPVKWWRNKDLMQTTGIIVQEWDRTPEPERPQAIMVDSIGLGAGVVDRLKEEGLPARGVNVAEQSSARDEYQRLRDELWFKVRDWLDAKDCHMAKDDDLSAELATVRYDINSSGKIKVEGKDEMKKRGVRSPDLADAFCLTFAHAGRISKSRAPLVFPKDHISNSMV
jgi:hypothetical protein